MNTLSILFLSVGSAVGGSVTEVKERKIAKYSVYPSLTQPFWQQATLDPINEKSESFHAQVGRFLSVTTDDSRDSFYLFQ